MKILKKNNIKLVILNNITSSDINIISDVLLSINDNSVFKNYYIFFEEESIDLEKYKPLIINKKDVICLLKTLNVNRIKKVLDLSRYLIYYTTDYQLSHQLKKILYEN